MTDTPKDVTKSCSKCKTEKPLSHFYKDKRTSDGLYSACKKCHYYKKPPHKHPATIHRNALKNNPTPYNVAFTSLCYIKQRICVGKDNYNKIKNYLTMTDLVTFYETRWDEYLSLHNQWRKYGFSLKFRPTIDRIDAAGDYVVPNIQLLTFSDNARKAQLDKKQTAEHLAKKNL